MEHLLLLFRHGVPDLIPCCPLIERLNDQFDERQIGRYIGSGVHAGGAGPTLVLRCLHTIQKANRMPKPNYQFEKRQREQQKKLKKVEKAQRKAHAAPAEQSPNTPPTPGEPASD